MSKPTYQDVFKKRLDANGDPIDVDELFAEFEVKPATVSKYLKEFLRSNHKYIGRVIGFYPDADTVIDLAEKAVGLVSGRTVSAVNYHCKEVIDAITKPKHQKFLDVFFNGHLEIDRKTVRVERDTLINFIYDEYVDFVHESDNGLVSIAGSMNEKILIRGLENTGLVKNTDYRKTGTNSEGDVQIEHRGKSITKILKCEIKSYAARERLLRGLQDIKDQEKIGVGFFNNPAEFNPDRTQTLIDAGPLAIYMPDETLSNVDKRSIVKTTARQDRVYRPLSKFFTDMLEYKCHGRLPPNN